MLIMLCSCHIAQTFSLSVVKVGRSGISDSYNISHKCLKELQQAKYYWQLQNLFF